MGPEAHHRRGRGLGNHRGGSLTHIWKLVALEFGLAIFSDFLSRANSLCDSLLGDRFTNRVSVRLMQHATALDLATFEDPVFYDKLERARRQTTGRMGLMAGILNVAQDTLSLISLSAGLIVFSPWLMVLLVAAVIPAFLGETHYSKLAYSVLFRRTPQRRQLDYLRLLGASAQSAKEVKIFGLGEYLSDRYRDVAQSIETENRSLAIRRAISGSALNLVSTGGYYGAYAAVLMRTLGRRDLPRHVHVFDGGVFAFAVLYREDPLELQRHLRRGDVPEGSVRLLRDPADDSLAAGRHPRAAPDPRWLRVPERYLRYPGAEKAVVRGINFRLHAGEKVALIGQNGAGKTTLVKLLARLYDPTEGRILLDGIDLRDYDVEDLRREIGVIFQDYMRYDAIVRENIGFGNIEALGDQERIRSAAFKSLAKGVIDKLAGGIDQMVGRRFDGGVDLSGGEWQKFALARAYMRDAQLLILDEPTATLDARAEYEVFQRFAELTRGRMAVLISHRFSTVRMADRILVLSGGQIKEEGTHSELLAVRGHYAELFELQAAGYR